MGWGPLRVINEDRVALEGALEHRDSLGTGSVIRPGEVQRMTAGTGVRHSEYNASKTEPVRLLQIWIEPARTGLPPGYEQKTFSDADKRERVRLIASSDGREGSVTINQHAAVYATVLAAEQRVTHTLARRRRGWLQVARGTLTFNGQALAHGDGCRHRGRGDAGDPGDRTGGGAALRLALTHLTDQLGQAVFLLSLVVVRN